MPKTQRVKRKRKKRSINFQPKRSARIQLKNQVNSNRRSLGKMNPLKQLGTCCICLEEIALEKEARLNNCDHKFCHPCIKKWVVEMENSCPLCKEKIEKIIFYDTMGREKSTNVKKKVQEYDHFEDMYCEDCHGRIYERNFDALNRTNDTAAICDDCMEVGMHLRCMRS